MTLLEHMNTLTKLRDPSIPTDPGDICLVLRAAELDSLDGIMARLPDANLKRLALWDVSRAQGHKGGVPVNTLREPGPGGLKYVCLLPRNDLHNDILWGISKAVAEYGVEKIYLLRQEAEQTETCRTLPDFYAGHEPQLEAIYHSLADAESRRTYAARVKAMLEGDPGYLPIARYPSYHHPLVHPEAGDILIDGGVSDMVREQEKLAEAVGPRGSVLGFEPIPYMCASAKTSLAEHANYHLFCQGLGEKKERLRFSDQRDSSRVSDGPEGTVECEMISIDEFMAEHKIRKLNCIKLDVEGSEAAALKGARGSIARFHPKLIVCLYHKPEDIFEIPALVKSLAPEYDLRISHHSASFLDTILYARVPG